MLKILHCADLHLDSPFTDSLHKGEARRAKLRSVFTNMIAFAQDKKVDLFLISGDLFDSEFASKDTAAFLSKAMASLPSCQFVIAPGNHDPYTASSIYACTDFPENVSVFSSSSPTCLCFDDLGADVYGYAFTESSLPRAPIASLRPIRRERLNLLCAHADLLSPLSPYAPTTKEALSGTEMDYVALGHIHACSDLQKAGNTYYAYPGCPEGRGFDELGYKGALYLEMEKDNGCLQINVSQIRFSVGRYEIARVDLTGAKNTDEALSSVRACLKESKLLGMDTTLRLILSGTVSPEVTHLAEEAQQMLRDLVYALEIRDATAPLLDADYLMNDMSIRGAFFRQLRPELESEDEETRARALRALHLGLSALADQPISKDFTPQAKDCI